MFIPLVVVETTISIVLLVFYIDCRLICNKAHVQYIDLKALSIELKTKQFKINTSSYRFGHNLQVISSCKNPAESLLECHINPSIVCDTFHISK